MAIKLPKDGVIRWVIRRIFLKATVHPIKTQKISLGKSFCMAFYIKY